MTEGRVDRQLIAYAIPMVAGNLLQACYSMADMMLAGHFITGGRGISAINNSSQIMLLLTNIIIGITMGGNVVVGQYFGKKDEQGRREAAGTLLCLAVVCGILIAGGLYAVSQPLLQLLGAPAMKEALAYLRICCFGVPFIFLYNAIAAILRAMGNSKTPLRFVAASTITNIALDILMMGVMQWGTAGAALATVLSQVLCCTLASGYLLSRKDLFRLDAAHVCIVHRQLKLILRVGIPSALQMTIAGFSWLVVTFLINQYGVDVSAGNGVSVKIKDFSHLFITAMSSASSSMIAQTLGAGKYDRAKEVLYAAIGISVKMALGIICIVQLTAPLLVRIFTPDPAVAEAAVRNLRIEIFGEIFYAVFLNYHALAIGAGHTIFAMGSSFVNCIVVRVVLATLFQHYFGIVGVYVACMIAPSSSIPLGWLYTRSNVWRKTLVSS